MFRKLSACPRKSPQKPLFDTYPICRKLTCFRFTDLVFYLAYIWCCYTYQILIRFHPTDLQIGAERVCKFAVQGADYLRFNYQLYPDLFFRDWRRSVDHETCR